MVQPLVSVVMPTHNRRDDLARAARSVLAQDVDNLELIIVDDASSDATPALLDELSADSRVRVVQNDRSLGECGARNRGLEVAEGELIAFCDDDDAWLPDAARGLVGALMEHRELGGVSSWYQVLHASTGRAVIFRGPREYGAEQLLWQNLTIVFGMYRRSAFSVEPRFDPNLVTGGDWDFWLRIALEQPVRSIAQVLYLYRQHDRGQATDTVSGHLQGRREFLAKHGAKMSPACRLYHETIIAGYEHGRVGMVKTLTTKDPRRATRRDSAFVSFVLASSLVASRVGVLLRDPGLQARVMASLVGGGR